MPRKGRTGRSSATSLSEGSFVSLASASSPGALLFSATTGSVSTSVSSDVGSLTESAAGSSTAGSSTVCFSSFSFGSELIIFSTLLKGTRATLRAGVAARCSGSRQVNRVLSHTLRDSAPADALWMLKRQAIVGDFLQIAATLRPDSCRDLDANNRRIVPQKR